MPEPSLGVDLEELRQRILKFLGSCRMPILKEADAEPLAVAAERLSLEIQGNRLQLQAWDDRRSMVRRVLRLRSATPRALALAVHRFGGGEGTLTLAETSLRGGNLERDQRRKRFRERFRKLLSQQFPGWKIESLSAARDLRRTFSEHYARAVLRQGQTAWAAVGVAEKEGDTAAAQILTDGLLWLDHLRLSSQKKPLVLAGLHLFVPRGTEQLTANRLAFLDPARARYNLFRFSRGDEAELVDKSDYGNLRTELGAPRFSAAVSAAARALLNPLARFPGVEEEITADGELSLRFRGFEFAHAAGELATFREMPLGQMDPGEAKKDLEELARIRVGDSRYRNHPFYTRAPERWMESLVKTNISVLSLDLAEGPVYSQTLSVAGPARGVIDLLTVTREGRLVVLELKADEDPQLPLQGLDYWMRAKWHLERGDFRARGYFPGCRLSSNPPLLWLVFPSMRLHAVNEIVLKYFSPAVPVTLLGVNEDWRKDLRVVFRG